MVHGHYLRSFAVSDFSALSVAAIFAVSAWLLVLLCERLMGGQS